MRMTTVDATGFGGVQAIDDCLRAVGTLVRGAPARGVQCEIDRRPLPACAPSGFLRNHL
jgi:hypothetical protein